MNLQKYLSRNYYEYPLQYGETPNYEDIRFLWIDQNLTLPEVAEYLNCKPSRVGTAVRKLGLKKDSKQRAKAMQRTVLKKYGVTSVSKLEEFKEKAKQTSLRKYGTESPNQCEEIKNKIKATNLKKYGFTSSSKSDIVKQKVKQTNLERYGVEYYTQTSEFLERSKQTNLEEYGVEHVAQAEIFKEKAKKTNLERYGVECHLSLKEVIEKRKKTCLEKWGTTNVSTKHIDLDILKILNDKQLLLDYVKSFEQYDLKEIANIMGISYEGLKKKLHDFDIWDEIPHGNIHAETELSELFPDFHKTRQILKPQEIDLYNEDYKLGIEFNGNYWHSDIFKHKNYHQDKSKLATEKGIFLYHIFEYEWEDPRKKKVILSQLNNLMGKNTVKIGARKCTIKELDNTSCQKSLQENHLQGKDQSSVRIGLFFNEELISVMTFCKPRFTNKYQWELSRFCNKLNTSVIGAASKLFKYFVEKYNPQSIISYSNYAKTKGILYSILGFKYDKLTAPNYVWHYAHTVLSRYQCQKHKLKEFYNLGNTEEEIMRNRGFSKLYDCGNFVWTWHKA